MLKNSGVGDAGWYAKQRFSQFRQWWDGEEWTGRYQRNGLLRWQIAPSSGVIRAPFDWLWAALRSFVLALILVAIESLLYFLGFITLDSETWSGLALILMLALLLPTTVLVIFSSIAFQVGVIGLGVRSGIAAVEHELAED
jgi:hypothetical protein